MKILHASHRFSPCLGGIETHVKQLCENLAKKGHECKVVCLNKCPNSSQKLPASESLGKTKVKRVGFLDLGFYKIAPGVFGKLGDVEIVHVHGLGYFSDKLAATKPFHRRKLILSTHGGVFHTKRLGLLKKPYFFGWNRIALKAFDKVIAVSKADYELFSRIVPREKLELIENPVEVEDLASLKRKAEPNSFLFVGRLSKNKGLVELLETFALVKKKRPGFRLRIVGKEFDQSKGELKRKIGELGLSGNVQLLGMVSDKALMEAYAASSAFVSASKYEGFGISALEAMAAGLVPILNDIPPFRRLVESGKNGFITDFGSREKAAETILQAMQLSSAERKRMEAGARALAKKFSWKESIGKFEKLYEECLVQN